MTNILPPHTEKEDLWSNAGTKLFNSSSIVFPKFKKKALFRHDKVLTLNFKYALTRCTKIKSKKSIEKRPHTPSSMTFLKVFIWKYHLHNTKPSKTYLSRSSSGATEMLNHKEAYAKHNVLQKKLIILMTWRVPYRILVLCI